MKTEEFKKNLMDKSRIYLLAVLVVFLFYKKTNGQTSRPNFLIICTDDMSKSSVSIYDTASLLPTPNINRIGEEGLNVTKYYSTNSLCIPGRASLLTGKYGHETGAVNNFTTLNTSIPTFPKILHDNGYYTALCGKWMVGSSSPKPEFDYWLWTPKKTNYFDDTCRYFDSAFVAYGHITDMLTDSVLSLISRVDTPFMIMLNHNAPHAPYISQTQFDGMFSSVNFPLPPNFPAYYKNYPSPVYDDSAFFINNAAGFETITKKYFEMVAGIDQSTGKILDSLDELGLLENTMVIFTTDNGFMIGPHHLKGKEYPYEEAIGLPLLIRYPAWFTPGSLIDSSFVINTDVTPTILEAAGISDSVYLMDGKSIHRIFNHDFNRDQFLYEVVPPTNNSIPQVRAVRTNSYQYNRYYCADTTEELFDMTSDPYQITNLVHDCNYQVILAQFRIKLDSFRIAENDTLPISDSCNCQLMNPVYTCCIPYTQSDSAVICYNDAYNFHSLVLTATGNYSFTVFDSTGCDSVFHIHLSELPPKNHFFAATICSNENVNFYGTVYNTTGIYTHVLTASNGCDSVLHLNLSVLSAYNHSYADTLCFGETYNFHGNILTASGNYQAVLTAINGCDSMVNLNLTILPDYTTELNQSICTGQSFQFNGNNYSTSGIYSANYISSFGCDSIVTLNLIVSNLISAVTNVFICDGDSFLFNSTVIYTSGNYTDTLTAIAGCDSISILNLFVVNPVFHSTSDTICFGETYNFNGTILNNSGVYFDTLISAMGCDSVSELTLTMLPEISTTDNAAICFGDTYNFNGTLLNNSGNYTSAFISATGCDSIVQLQLSVGSMLETSVLDTICQWETYNFNGTLLNQSGTYSSIYNSINNCDSVVTLYLTKILLQPGINISGDTLSTIGNGTIQWINCNTDTLIPNETGSLFIPTQTGNYAAIISNGNCSDTTNCKHVTISGIKEIEMNRSQLHVFPNPTDGIIVVSLSEPIVKSTLEIANTLGQIIYSKKWLGKSMDINMSNFPKGIYFITLHSPNENFIKKLVLQ